MYVPVHLETRYVGAFLLLLCCGFLNLTLPIFRSLSRPLVFVITILVAAVLIFQVVKQARGRYFQIGQGPDQDSLGAAALESMGVRPGDRVARVPGGVPGGMDLGIERIARVEIISEVDLTHAREFWTAPEDTQHKILNIFWSQGVKAVIATEPRLSDANRAEWKQLASTKYWVWLPMSDSNDPQSPTQESLRVTKNPPFPSAR